MASSRAVIGERSRPGAMALMRMPCPAWSAASARTSDSTPPFAAAIAAWLATPMPATTELKNTAAPGRRAAASAPSQACAV